MAPTAATLPPTVNENSSLPVAAIVFIAIGAYVIVFAIAVLVRQCLLTRGISLCPEWVNEMCCTSCSCISCMCITHIAELCDFNVPSKHSCLDSCCPTKEHCDDMVCCCMNSLPGGSLCDDCTGTGPECQCGDCNCNCNCQMPECNSINCICFEIQLKQPGASRGPPVMAGNIQGHQGYYGRPAYPAQQMNYGNPMSFANPANA